MAKCCILNLNKNAILASEAEVADTSWRRMKGLLGRKAEEFGAGKALWIMPSQGVHTIGMSFPIDVAYLDKDRKVIHMCHDLMPYRVAAIKMRSRSVIEFPAGTLARTGTALGDVLEISEVNC